MHSTRIFCPSATRRGLSVVHLFPFFLVDGGWSLIFLVEPAESGIYVYKTNRPNDDVLVAAVCCGLYMRVSYVQAGV